MDVTVEEIETIAVLGAGNMGHGIAEVAALAGFDVRMRDIEEEFVRDGYGNIEWSLGKLDEKDRLDEAPETILDRIEPVVDLDAAVADADVVIEAVPERMDVKREVYHGLVEYAPDRAIFATNTSSLSITELAEETDRPERFCGMHFFNPPVRMELVEVIAGAHTDEATLSLVEDLAEAMGKTPVRVRKDSPGFVVNRVLVPLMNEAAWLVHADEATIETVDATAAYTLGLPMGVFELTDQVGIDVAHDVLEYLHERLGDAYEPAPLLTEKVETEELGRKTGRGFYDYDGGAEVPADAADPDLATLLRAVMANEVAKLVGESVAGPDAIDLAMRLGAGFPEGPARMADEAGLDGLLGTLRERHGETGAARYEPAPELVRRVEADEPFHGAADDGERSYETITVERREGRVGHVELDRQHRMNTITPDALDEIEAAVEELDADDDVRAIVLTGAGDRAFSAGADLQAITAAPTPFDAADLSRRGQEAFGAVESAGLPVVAAIDGYCLGGGMELATVADLRVASPNATFGQTEQDLGLMPGWGGTQRLRHVVGGGRAREIILTAERYDAETMADYGFVNEIDEDATERAFELARKLAAGPPVAQRLTKRAMLVGREDAEAGLEIESQAFGLLTTTDDLLEGVSAFQADRDPEFEGR